MTKKVKTKWTKTAEQVLDTHTFDTIVNKATEAVMARLDLATQIENAIKEIDLAALIRKTLHNGAATAKK